MRSRHPQQAAPLRTRTVGMPRPSHAVSFRITPIPASILRNLGRDPEPLTNPSRASTGGSGGGPAIQIALRALRLESLFSRRFHKRVSRAADDRLTSLSSAYSLAESEIDCRCLNRHGLALLKRRESQEFAWQNLKNPVLGVGPR